MDQINIYDAKKNLSQIIRKVEKGESVIISRHNQPVAELKPLFKGSTKLRPNALGKGDFVVPDDFNDPLPESIISDFEGK